MIVILVAVKVNEFSIALQLILSANVIDVTDRAEAIDRSKPNLLTNSSRITKLETLKLREESEHNILNTSN